jgi:NAD(P)-dependent dehydrogenase (short-subunit alcohol dehydrogenase family)
MMCDYRDALITDVQKDDSAMDKIEEVVNTNFLGLVHVTRKAYRLMEASNDYGIIINISMINTVKMLKLGNPEIQNQLWSILKCFSLEL